MGSRTGNDLKVRSLGEVCRALHVGFDDIDVDTFAAQPVSDIGADLSGSDNDYSHGVVSITSDGETTDFMGISQGSGAGRSTI